MGSNVKRTVVFVLILSLLILPMSFAYEHGSRALKTDDDKLISLPVEPLIKDFDNQATLEPFTGRSDRRDPVSVTDFPGSVVDTPFWQPNICDASAARRVLRHSAKIEKLKNFEEPMADVDFDGKITAADARIMLRYTAKLGGFPLTLHVGQELKFGPLSLFIGVREIKAVTPSTPEFKIETETIPLSPDPNPGATVKKIFHATPTAPGNYSLEVVCIGYDNQLLRRAVFDITCIA